MIYVLEEANGPGTGPKTFATRRSYDTVKESVHETFPTAFGVALIGLAISYAGTRVAGRRASEE